LQGINHKNFERLKKKIVEVMQQSYPGINPSIAEWKGQEITDFQEDLRIKVNANISEKWFYTHMKSPDPTFPRIDMLNILSKYAGYANWDEFVFENGQKILIPKPQVDDFKPKPKVSANRFFIMVPLLAVATAMILFGLYTLFSTREYRFTFIDADTRQPITGNRTEVILLPEGESPVHTLIGSDGSYKIRTAKSKIKMVVKTPYYQCDTIVRILKKLNGDEIIELKADDYSLMIHYFSMMKVDDWEKRKKHLETMIDDDAMIYQVLNDKEATGMALFNKQEFIDRMTMPTGSLRNIEILDSRFRNDKILVLKFRINDNKR
jgi:hypothetical protein